MKSALVYAERLALSAVVLLSCCVAPVRLGGDQTPHYELDDLLAAQTVREREAKKGK